MSIRHQARLALLGCASIMAFGAGASQASAQTLAKDYWINGQAYYPKVDTNVRVTAETAQEIGTDIDFETDLGFDDRDFLPAVTVGARFNRVVVGFDYFRLKRSSTAELAREITFDDTTYPLNAEVTSGFNSNIYRLTVGYSFVRKEDLEIGAALGVHATRFTMSIEGEAAGQEFDAELTARSRKVLAPLPTVGLYGTWRIADRLETTGRVDYLSLKIGDYDGKLVNAQLGVNYLITDNIALGVAYRYVDYRLGVDKEFWNGRVRYRLNGPAIVAQAAF